MKEKKIEQVYIYFGIIMLFVVIFINAWMTHKYYFYFLSSDDAAELILSKMLAHEGGILSRNWHYSTELEILNTQLVYSFLFRFISNFKVVRIMGQVVLTCIFLLSYYFCLYSIDSHMANSRFFKTAFLMLLPISPAWIFLIMKTYYIPHVSISFFALGFACQIQKESISRRKKTGILISGCLLAFAGCLEGLRHIQLAYLPLVLSSVFMLWNSLEKVEWDLKKFNFPRGIGINICWLLSAGMGCLVNLLVLSNVYQVQSHDDEKFTEIVSFESIQNVWNAFLEVVGYRGEQKLLSIGGICNAVAVVSACLILYFMYKIFINIKKYDFTEQLLISFVVISFAFSVFIFIVLHSVVSRWVLACFVPAILLLIFLERLPFIKQYLIFGGIYCVVILFGVYGYQEIRTDVSNENKRNVYDFIQQNDYSYGYCTMWVGDWLTEMTNGRFESRSVRGDYENGKLKIWHWLTPIQVEYREEPILCILEKRRVEDLPIPEEWPVVMEDDYYIIYELNDHKRAEAYLESREGFF